MSTDVGEFVADLDGGLVEEKLSRILSDVAGAVIDHNAAGEVILKLNLKRLAQSYQVVVNHTIKYTRPTSRGKVTEDESTSTPMYVGEDGKLSFMQENQHALLNKKGQVQENV
ncbi:hypothetical protein [Candidatus Sororendozoicomonas aggregata]|uniref:hypothetical protein n=1 Tax=Candidatus Sororendozoicomonas aggregata TaxID=3073239 RepID=UPI002ED53C64